MERLRMTWMMAGYPSGLALFMLCVIGLTGFLGGVAHAADPHVGKSHRAVLAGDEVKQQPSPASTDETQRAKVYWYQWEDAAFERANAEDKLIFLDLTAVWCHACHVMDRTTYSDPQIIEWLNSRFVPIRVDTDRRPDLEARYRSGGWPTTSVLLQSGEILFQANFLEPEELKVVLEETESSYRTHKAELVTRAADVWTKVHAATNQKTPPKGPIDEAILHQSVLMMQQSFDRRHGGFSDAPKFFEPDAITLAFLVYHRTKNNDLKQMALKTLDVQLRLFDPVWGGFYRYAEESDWSKPHYEKMLDIQAVNLQNYLEAYQVTQDPTYKEVAEQIIRYVNRFLADRSRGQFYSSQNADVVPHQSGSRFVAGEAYFPLTARQRVEIGIPDVDRAVYTSSNGLMITSYLRAFQVLGEPQLRDVALKALNHLHQERYRAGAGIAHVMVGGEPEGFGLLADQVSFARASVEAFLATGERSYLKKGEQVVADLQQLEDQRLGGFFDRPRTASDQGLLRFPYKPNTENLRASLVLSDLFYLTGKQQYRERAERTIRVVLDSDEALPIPLVGSVVDRLLNYPVHVVVVGSKTQQATKGLFKEALRLYAPGKIARLLDPAEDSLSIGEVTFPPSGTPQAYICTDRFCSKPIQDPAALEETLAMVLAAGLGRTPSM